MDLKEISQIVELMNEHGLSLFHLEKDDFNLKLKKGGDLEQFQKILASLPQQSAPAPVAVPISGQNSVASEAAPTPAAAPLGEAIDSPMVGTFYRKPAPDAPNFVEVGAKVSEGQTLCIIEAMKVMNEIKAEKSGEIAEICVSEGDPVQYGDILFRLK